MLGHDRWLWKSSKYPYEHNSYNGILNRQKEYEDPADYYTEPPEHNFSKYTHSNYNQNQSKPPPLPPPVKPFDVTFESNCSKSFSKNQDESNNIISKKVLIWSIFAATIIVFSCSLVFFVFMAAKADFFEEIPLKQTEHWQDGITVDGSTAISNKGKVEVEITPNYLLTLLITKRKICLFEASSNKLNESRQIFRDEHIEYAQQLDLAEFTEDGVPVHPLYFQRIIRNLGVDSDCHVIIYDRGRVLWATYAFWMFTLFGHTTTSILLGGFPEWKRLQQNSTQYRTENGAGTYNIRKGNFKAKWNSDVICTFDDVIANSDLKTYDLVDAQDKEQYDGIGTEAVFGHIRSAINIPIDDVYNWHQHKWLAKSKLVEYFTEKGLSRSKGIIIYCATSSKASMIFYALNKCDYKPIIYFGSWPEWLIRAPDFLKALPEIKIGSNNSIYIAG